MVKKRFVLAFVASLALHALVLLLPEVWWFHGEQAPAPVVLAVRLPPLARTDVLATAVDEPPLPLRAEPATLAADTSASTAVPPPPRAPSAPGLAARESPRPLQGRALQSALAALTREEFYPREAIARGLEGRVVLLLTLDEAGRVARIEVASSSGHALLDEAACKAATRIGRLPADRRQVLLPVEFRLE
ncbi:MAG: energy transducer TonB [Rhodocyclaceae bacterium]